MKTKTMNILFILSFIFYIVFLLWNIIFKYISPMELFSYGRFFSRSINLIPFNDIIKGYYNSIDILGNVILFIPLGIYINMYLKNSTILQYISIIFGISFMFEIFQYVFALGVSDITDLITNTFGGIIGICIFLTIKNILKDEGKIKTFITICSTLVMIIVSGMITMLFIIN